MKLKCPNPGCRSENDAQAERCHSCGAPFRQYANLSIYSAQLFNCGLAAAKNGDFGVARDNFAAVVRWCPMDREARNAWAMACFALGDFKNARDNWQTVLEKWPHDEFAKQGMEALENGDAKLDELGPTAPQKKSQTKKSGSEKSKHRKKSRRQGKKRRKP